MTHICVSKLSIHGSDNGLSPGRRNQCWNIVNLILGNKLHWNLNRNQYIFIQENAFENVVWKVLAICLGLNVLRDYNDNVKIKSLIQCLLTGKFTLHYWERFIRRLGLESPCWTNINFLGWIACTRFTFHIVSANWLLLQQFHSGRTWQKIRSLERYQTAHVYHHKPWSQKHTDICQQMM